MYLFEKKHANKTEYNTTEKGEKSAIYKWKTYLDFETRVANLTRTPDQLCKNMSNNLVISLNISHSFQITTCFVGFWWGFFCGGG